MSQHMDALARANEIRLARAELKRQIRRGQIDVGDVLSDVPQEARTMTVAELLCSQTRWGDQRTNRLLRSIPVSPMRPVAGLTSRERGLISYRLSMSPAELRLAA